MQKTLLIKLSIITGLCIIFSIGLSMIDSVIYERQNYAESVIREIAQQHVNPQEVITPFIAVPTTVIPECQIDTSDPSNIKSKCAQPYSSVETIFASQTQATQDLEVSTDTYQRSIYHATSYSGALKFSQSYTADQVISSLSESMGVTNDETSVLNAPTDKNKISPKQTTIHWDKAKLIIPISDLRGVPTLPAVTIDQTAITANYPQTPLLKGLTYIEVAIPQGVLNRLAAAKTDQQNPSSLTDVSIDTAPINKDSIKTDLNNQPANLSSANVNDEAVTVTIDLPLSGISHLSTIPTGQNFGLTMRSDWQTPNFIGEALPNTKNLIDEGFEANWKNQYLTIANNQQLSQCVRAPNNQCTIISQPTLDVSNQLYPSDSYPSDSYSAVTEGVVAAENEAVAVNPRSVQLSSFGVSFASPTDVYLQTERTMKYALLLMLVSFGTFFLFEVLKSSRIHPIQYLLVGCALFVFYVLLLPLAEQIAFWQAYTVAASACVGLIGWYTYYVLGSIKRAGIFTATLAGLYASFFGILSTEDLNLLLGAIFCFVILACVMIITRKLDWYKIA